MYSCASGQVINFQKSAIVFSRNTPQNVRQDLLQILEVTELDQHDKYLGLPSAMGRSKRTVFNHTKGCGEN